MSKKIKQQREPMEVISIYGDRQTNLRVEVLKVEALEEGSRVHYRYRNTASVKVMGRNAFKNAFYNVAGLVV